MSFYLHRIRRALAEPPEEPMTHALRMALTAHWRTLYEDDPVKYACMAEHLKGMQAVVVQSDDSQEQLVTAVLAEWEAKRAAFRLEATLGGPPGKPGKLQAPDWGTHWVLFDWKAPATGGPVWGYRLERSADNRDFYLVDITIETEVTLQRQPPGRKFYYRVVPFNGWGDGPPSATVNLEFDPKVEDVRKRPAAKQ
jgi:hypothetical protein